MQFTADKSVFLKIQGLIFMTLDNRSKKKLNFDRKMAQVLTNK